jgi:hypothetical protein
MPPLWSGDMFFGPLNVAVQLGIPIEIIPPGFVQEVRRKAAAIVLQLWRGGLKGFDLRVHMRFFGAASAFAQIARRASRGDVDPAGTPAMAARRHMIKGQIIT